MTWDAGIFGLAAAKREQRGISVEEISRSTKITARYLRAIENAEFELLPGGVYNTSYIRQYARATGFDEEALLGAYRGSESPEERNSDPPRITLSALLAAMKNRLAGVFGG
jgi:cytoskeletal protein RodZ